MSKNLTACLIRQSVFNKWARVKYLSAARFEERRDLFWSDVVTSVGRESINFKDKRHARNIRAEANVFFQRYMRKMAGTPNEKKDKEQKDWFNKHRLIIQNRAQSMVEGDSGYNRANRAAGKVLATGARAAAISRLAADTALLCTGLGGATSTFGVKVLVQEGKKAVVKNFLVGLGTGYSLSVADTWAKAKDADVTILVTEEAEKTIRSKANNASAVSSFLDYKFKQGMKTHAQGIARDERFLNKCAQILSLIHI